MISVIALGCVLVGRPTAGASLQRRAEAFRVVPRPEAPMHPAALRVAVHALVGVPLGLASLVVTADGWSLVLLNVADPIRGASDLSDAWGGPSLAGAWAVHSAGRPVFLFVAPLVVKLLVAMHRRGLGVAGLAE